jgi:hypothetical protein
MFQRQSGLSLVSVLVGVGIVGILARYHHAAIG